jgi:nucleotide-binding universal stress UspA family protein
MFAPKNSFDCLKLCDVLVLKDMQECLSGRRFFMLKQKIVIAIPLEEPLLRPLHEWGKKFDFSQVESVHIVHILKKNISPLEFGLIESPDEATYREMEPTLKKFLEDEAGHILPEDYYGPVNFLLTLDFHPEQRLIDILREINATLVVVATSGKHGLEGLFHSSFTGHMIKFSPCDVLVVRPIPGGEKAA